MIPNSDIPYDSSMQPEISTKSGWMNNENDRSKKVIKQFRMRYNT